MHTHTHTPPSPPPHAHCPQRELLLSPSFEPERIYHSSAPARAGAPGKNVCGQSGLGATGGECCKIKVGDLIVHFLRAGAPGASLWTEWAWDGRW